MNPQKILLIYNKYLDRMIVLIDESCPFVQFSLAPAEGFTWDGRTKKQSNKEDKWGLEALGEYDPKSIQLGSIFQLHKNNINSFK